VPRSTSARRSGGRHARGSTTAATTHTHRNHGTASAHRSSESETASRGAATTSTRRIPAASTAAPPAPPTPVVFRWSSVITGKKEALSSAPSAPSAPVPMPAPTAAGGGTTPEHPEPVTQRSRAQPSAAPPAPPRQPQRQRRRDRRSTTGKAPTRVPTHDATLADFLSSIMPHTHTHAPRVQARRPRQHSSNVRIASRPAVPAGAAVPTTVAAPVTWAALLKAKPQSHTTHNGEGRARQTGSAAAPLASTGTGAGSGAGADDAASSRVAADAVEGGAGVHGGRNDHNAPRRAARPRRRVPRSHGTNESKGGNDDDDPPKTRAEQFQSKLRAVRKELRAEAIRVAALTVRVALKLASDPRNCSPVAAHGEAHFVHCACCSPEKAKSTEEEEAHVVAKTNPGRTPLALVRYATIVALLRCAGRVSSWLTCFFFMWQGGGRG